MGRGFGRRGTGRRRGSRGGDHELRIQRASLGEFGLRLGGAVRLGAEKSGEVEMRLRVLGVESDRGAKLGLRLGRLVLLGENSAKGETIGGIGRFERDRGARDGQRRSSG
jgi:hypothetical protein